MKLKSVFKEKGEIPKKYTCDGEDVNPPLEISDVPKKAKSMVLIVDDPDAPKGSWGHWIVWNISPDTTKIEENSVPLEAVQGLNDFGKNNYGGPCPPSGSHKYKFNIYALDTVLNVSPNSEKIDVEREIKGHIIAKTSLTGRYSKS